MKKQIILCILFLFAVFANAQPIPKSIDKPIITQTTQKKVGMVKKDAKKTGSNNWKKNISLLEIFMKV